MESADHARAAARENRGRDIDVGDDFVDPRACRQATARHQQRHPHRRLIRRPLVDETVLAEREAVVSHEHDDRRIRHPALAEQRHHAAHAVVNGEQRFRVAPVILGNVERAVIREVHAVPAVPLVPHPHRLPS
jgi:hypothetical protein